MSWPQPPRSVTGGVLQKQRLRWSCRFKPSAALGKGEGELQDGAGVVPRCWPDKALGATLEQVLPINGARPVTPASLRLWLRPTRGGHSSVAGSGPGLSDSWGLYADFTPGPMMRWSWLPWAHKTRC